MLRSDDPPLADVTACAACGHQIAGLPPMGRCPECGEAYDRRVLVAFGQRAHAVWRTWTGPVVGGLMLLAVAQGPHGWWHISMLAIAASGVGGTAWVSWRRTAERPGSARVRLGPTGVAIDDEPPPVPLHVAAVRAAAAAVRTTSTTKAWVAGGWIGWANIVRLRLTPTRQGRWRLRVERRHFVRGKRVPIDVVLAISDVQAAAVRDFVARHGGRVEG